jgi:hypothetical protein
MAPPLALVPPGVQLMRKLVLALAALLCLPGIGFAKSAKLTQEDNVATLEFPDSWKISKRAKSPDEEVYVWAELVPADQIDTVQKEHDAYFEKQKVTMTKAEPDGKEVDGRKWAFIEPKATYQGKPTIIKYIIINPKVPSGKIIVFTYWASPKPTRTTTRKWMG